MGRGSLDKINGTLKFEKMFEMLRDLDFLQFGTLIGLKFRYSNCLEDIRWEGPAMSVFPIALH